MTVHQLNTKADGNFRDELLEVLDSRIKNIFICSSVVDLPDILAQAQEVGLMTEEHHYIISSLDLYTIDLEPFQHGETIMTGFRMIAEHDPLVYEVSDFFGTQHRKKEANQKDEDDEIMMGLTSESFLIENALIYDAGTKKT